MRPLNDFISEVKSKGLMRTANYTVVMSLPAALSTKYTTNLQNILMFCDKVDMPGVTVATAPVKTFGEVRETPYDRQFGTTVLTFFVDNDMKVKTMFDDWVNVIQDQETRLFEYYDKYKTDIKIHVEDIQGKKRYAILLKDCYPKNIGGITLDYSSKDVMKLSVTMNYRNWQHLPVTNEVMGIPSSIGEPGLAFQYINDFPTAHKSTLNGLASATDPNVIVNPDTGVFKLF